MEAVEAFRKEVIKSYNLLSKDSRIRMRLVDNPVKVAVIDDGVNPRKLGYKGSLKGGWPPDRPSLHGDLSTFYSSTEGHGTKMANLIQSVCPYVHLYVAKLDKLASGY